MSAAIGHGVGLTSSGFSPLGESPDSPHPLRRLRRQETRTGGAGGTRTHGRRIMSPSGILAALADQCPVMTFLLVRPGAPCLRPSVFSGPSLSLRPNCVPTPPPNGQRRRAVGRLRELRVGARTRPQRTPLPTARRLSPGAEAEPLRHSGSGAVRRPGDHPEKDDLPPHLEVRTLKGAHREAPGAPPSSDALTARPRIRETDRPGVRESIYNRSCILIYAAMCMRRPS